MTLRAPGAATLDSTAVSALIAAASPTLVVSWASTGQNADLTFDGEAGGWYRLVMRIKNTTGGTRSYSLRANAAASGTNHRSQHNSGNQVTTTAQDFDTDAVLVSTSTTEMLLDLTIQTKTGLYRMLTGTFATGSGTDNTQRTGTVCFVWSDTATAITSLRIAGDAANSFGAGSWAKLYRIPT